MPRGWAGMSVTARPAVGALGQRLLTGAAWVAGAQFFAAALSFFVSIVLARMLGPHWLGALGLLTWLTSAIAAVASLGVPHTIRKYVAEYVGRGEWEKAKALVARGVKVYAAAALLGVVLVSSYPWLVDVGSTSPDLFLLAGLAILPMAIESCLGSGLAGAQAFGLSARIGTVGALASAVLTVVAVGSGLGVRGILGAELLVAILTLGLRGAAFRKLFGGLPRERVSLDGERAGFMRYSGGMFLVLVANAVVWQRSEIVFIERYWSLETAGFYAVAYSLAGKAMMLPNALSAVLIPVISEREGRGEHRSVAILYERLVVTAAVGGILLVVVGVAAGPPLLALLYGDRYAPATLPFQILLAFNVFGIISIPMASAVFGSKGLTPAALVCTVVAPGVNLALAYWLVPSFGVVGAAAANGLTQAALVVATSLYLERDYGMRTPFRAVSAILLAGIAAGAGAIVVSRFLAGWPGGVAGALVGAAAFLGLLRLLQVSEALEAGRLVRREAHRLLRLPVSRLAGRVL